jgi:FkbM family methyltransferase
MNLKKTKFDYFEIHTLDNDGAVNKSIAQGELWEPHIINFLKCNSNKNGDFVDVGSNFGWHSLIASKFFSNVHSFEPQKVLCDLQRESINSSFIYNIRLYNVGLYNSIEDAELNPVYYEVEGYNTGDVSVGKGGEKIKLRTLDSYGLKRVDTIKIDVQGCEVDILKGMTETLKTCKHLIVELQHSQYNVGAPLNVESISFIESLGFELVTGLFTNNGPDGDYHFIKKTNI